MNAGCAGKSAISERRCVHDKALYKSTFTFTLYCVVTTLCVESWKFRWLAVYVRVRVQYKSLVSKPVDYHRKEKCVTKHNNFLDPNHTHFILVDSSEQASEIEFRSKFESRQIYGISYSVLILDNKWNSLPADITKTASLTAFRNRLKTFLFHHTPSRCSAD